MTERWGWIAYVGAHGTDSRGPPAASAVPFSERLERGIKGDPQPRLVIRLADEAERPRGFRARHRALVAECAHEHGRDAPALPDLDRGLDAVGTLGKPD